MYCAAYVDAALHSIAAAASAADAGNDYRLGGRGRSAAVVPTRHQPLPYAYRIREAPR